MEALEREDVAGQGDPRVGRDVRACDDAGRARPVELPVDAERDGAPGPAPEFPRPDGNDVRPYRDVGVEKHPLPVVLRRIAAEIDVLIEPKEDLPVEVVAVLRYRLDDPVRAAHQDLLYRAPRRALPIGHLESDAGATRDHHPPAALRQAAQERLLLERRAVEEDEQILLADELPLEVLYLAVEVRAVVLGEVGAEEAIGAVRRGDLAGAAQARDVRPDGVARVRVPVPPREREDALHVGRRQHLGEGLREQVLAIVRLPETRMLAVVVLEEGVDADRAVEAVAGDPQQIGPVVAVAAVVERVEVVPDDLGRRPRIGRVDLREGPGHDVARRLAGGAVDDRALRVEVVAPLVLLEGCAENGIVAEPWRFPAADLVTELAAAVRLEELVGQEVFRLFPVVAPEHHPGTEIGGDAARQRRRQEQQDDRAAHDGGTGHGVGSSHASLSRLTARRGAAARVAPSVRRGADAGQSENRRPR